MMRKDLEQDFEKAFKEIYDDPKVIEAFQRIFRSQCHLCGK